MAIKLVSVILTLLIRGLTGGNFALLINNNLDKCHFHTIIENAI